jgi:hypothetical protein
MCNTLPSTITIDAPLSSIRKKISITCPTGTGNSFGIYVEDHYQGDLRYSDKWVAYFISGTVLSFNDVQVLGDIIERNGYILPLPVKNL